MNMTIRQPASGSRNLSAPDRAILRYDLCLLILGNRDFAIVWTMLMLPVFVGAVLYARWVYVAMLTIYVLMSALLILIGAPKDPADSARTTAVFLVAVAI